MFKRKLGRSGIEINAMGLGCMEIGGKMKDAESFASVKENQLMFSLGGVDDYESVRAIHFALDHGVNFFDTAPAYGAGHSERVIGRALVGRRDKAIIATKFGKLIDEADNRFGRYENEREIINNIRKECESSLQRLNTDYIDLYQFHQLDLRLDNYADEVIAILESLASAGKIRWYGWSTDDTGSARTFAGGEHCTAIQHNLNLIEDAPEQLSLCEEFDLASIARGILGMGFLTGKYTAENYKSLLAPDDYRLRADSYFVFLLENLDKVREILTSKGRTLSQGALAWNWARSERTVPIPGFRTLAQVDENIGALEFGPLTTIQMGQINTLLGRTPE